MSKYTRAYTLLFSLCIWCVSISYADAAALKVSPGTGVYTVGSTFSVAVALTTDGKAVNAADGQLSFNPKELSVVGVSRGSSIFNLWTEEPTFSNAVGTVSFGGGSPSGFKGASGNVISITFKALSAGNPKVNFKSGSILAADGMGTNVLSGMSGATFTVSAASENPEPEYIAPANTPKAPVISSETHPDQSKWYKEKTAKLAWSTPDDITSVRMSLDHVAGTIPTNVYEGAVRGKTLEKLDEGVSYFHLQFKNKEGWGKVAHYKIAVDSEAPKNVSITETQNDTAPSGKILSFALEDISPISAYNIQIDGGEVVIFKDEKNTKQYPLPILTPGHHTVVVEAYDSAGNSTIATYALDIQAFEKPVFTDFPTRINTEVIPAIKGKTKPNAKVAIEVRRASDGTFIQKVEGSEGGDPFILQSDANGEFTYVPNNAFEQGVYVLRATAKDAHGQLSEQSDEIRIIVETPGYIALGTTMINILSVIVPLCALVVLLVFGTWYLWHHLSRWKKRVKKETLEAEHEVTADFALIFENLQNKVELLKKSRKGKLTVAETELITQIEQDLTDAQKKIGKEIADIEESI